MSGMSSENRVRLMYKYAAQLEGEMRSGDRAGAPRQEPRNPAGRGEGD